MSLHKTETLTSVYAADTRVELVGRLTTVTDWSGGRGGGVLIVQTRGYPIPLVREHSGVGGWGGGANCPNSWLPNSPCERTQPSFGLAEENPEHGHYPRNT